MNTLAGIIDCLRKFSNSDIGQIIEFISLLSWLYNLVKFYSKKAKGNLHIVKSVSFVIFIFLLGLVIPLIILIFSDWSTVVKVILNCLAIFCLFSFIFLLYIIKKMEVFIKKSDRKHQVEEATVNLRGTHVFFNGDLHIFFVDQTFFGYPIEHKITARIWSPNYDEMSIKKQGVGYSLNYDSNANYRIRIIRAEATEATFQVIKM